LPIIIDLSTLAGRSFGAVLDEVDPGWSDRVNFGFGETGPFTAADLIGNTGPPSPEEARRNALAIERGNEIRASLAPVIQTLRTRKLVIVGSLGEVSSQVWYVGGWRFQRNAERAVEWLEEPGRRRERREHYDPAFANVGDIAEKVEAFINHHRAELDKLPTQEAKAVFVAKGVGCSSRYVRGVVKDRSLKL
jgi:hypothetical protein